MGDNIDDVFDDLVGTREAAKLLKLHFITLSKMARDGKVPCVKLGGHYRFSKKILAKFILDGCQEKKYEQ